MELNDLNAFVQSLNNEFNTFPKLVTEDLIRRLYIENYCQKINSEIEIPYEDEKKRLILRVGAKDLFSRTPKRNGKYKRADLYDKSCDYAVEFKYHKKLDTGNTAKTDNFGYIFNDMNRLSLLENKRKLLVYVFDDEMYSYYMKNKRCPELCGEKGTTFSSSDIYSRTSGNEFKKRALSGFKVEYLSNFNYSVETLFSYDFILNDSKFYLRIYEIN